MTIDKLGPSLIIALLAPIGVVAYQAFTYTISNPVSLNNISAGMNNNYSNINSPGNILLLIIIYIIVAAFILYYLNRD